MNQNNFNINSIPEKELVVRDEIAYKNEEPFTGFASQCCEFIANSGWLKFTYYMPYQNGIKNGICKAYFENNQIKYEVIYKNGKKNGNFRDCYEKGKLQEEGVYKDDKKDGIWKTWFENGYKESEQLYDNDNNIDINKQGLFENDEFKLLSIGWYENGQLRFDKRIIKESELTIKKDWNKNGRLISQVSKENEGFEYLLEKTYYENGLLKAEENYIWGTELEEHREFGKIRHGVLKKWRKNGLLSFETKFKIGKENGVRKEWRENGLLYYLRTYKNGKKDGVYKEWYKNGRLAFEYNYKADIKEGNQKYFMSNGELSWISTYKYGQELIRKTMNKDYYEKKTYNRGNGRCKISTEYMRYDGTLLPKSEWPIPQKKVISSNDNNRSSKNEYYNDQLDMDQQSPEFWDNL